MTSFWTTTRLSSLAANIWKVITMPFALLLTGLRSIAGSFLGGGFLSLLLNPWTLGLLFIVGSNAWSYQKGKQHERRANAAAIVSLNNDLEALEKELALEERKREAALKKAVAGAAKVINARPVSSQCLLDRSVATQIANIAGGE